MKRESFKVQEDQIEDYTKDYGTWHILGENYIFIQSTPTDGDGECHSVITQRERDGKFFEFSWCYSGGSYFYEPEWNEVFKKTIVKEIYE